jgi:hypothetical protein
MLSMMRKATTPVSLYRLIYRSRDVIAQAMPDALTEEGLQREMRAIVASARWHNKADNLTGALMYTGAGFAQVLEGPREVVERRHADVTVLSFTPTQRRSFPDWPLAFCGQSTAGTVDPLGRLTDSAIFSGPHVTIGSDVLRLLERVVQQEDA